MGHSLSVIGDQIYIFGGGHHGQYRDTMFTMCTTTYELDVVNYENKPPEGRAFH